jgi:hypothetical protein
MSSFLFFSSLSRFVFFLSYLLFFFTLLFELLFRFTFSINPSSFFSIRFDFILSFLQTIETWSAAYFDMGEAASESYSYI